MKAQSVPVRGAVPEELTWDLQLMFKNETEWEALLTKVEALAVSLDAFKGSLRSSGQLLAFYKAEQQLDGVLSPLYVYAHLRADEDTGNVENQARQDRMLALLARIGERFSWVETEILANESDELECWISDASLSEFRMRLLRLVRRKEHMLSEKEEAILAGAAEIFGSAKRGFSLLTNADMRFPKLISKEGVELELSNARYILYLKDPDRAMRQQAYEKFGDSYLQFGNTLANALSTQVKQHNFQARLRDYGSALEASLFADQIPVELYQNLIDGVHGQLPLFYKYVALRARCLDLEQLNPWDLYVSIVPDYDLKVSYDQAFDWIIAACAPLGEEYVELLKQARRERWVDVSECRGKRSGAYSSGCFESRPYILMNYQDNLNSAFTLAHELGHSLHSWLSNHNQPRSTARYPIFIAEIASTLNEALLMDYLTKQSDDDDLKAYLLNNECEKFKGTVLRQTMFAEFELAIHKLDADGEPLTSSLLSDTYKQLDALYHGEQVTLDEQSAGGWMRIPHFYYNFYVYKYATSYCAAQCFFQQVMAGPEGRDAFLELLKSGGSADPLELISVAGVDMRSTSFYKQAFNGFERALTELQCLLEA